MKLFFKKKEPTGLQYPYIISIAITVTLILTTFMLYYYFERGMILSSYAQLDQNPAPPTRLLPLKQNQEYIRILSIEGGGIYGILPLHALQYLEQKSGKKIAELFDVMAGTSTGALAVVLMNVPDSEGKPRYSASDVLNIYNTQAGKIFYNPWYHRLLTMNGIIGPKYETTKRIGIFREYLGDLYFDHLVGNVIIPAYSVNLQSPMVFCNWKQLRNDNRNFPVADLLMGAISPPGLFPSVVFGSGHEKFILADGAVFANDPSLAAILIAMHNYPNKKYILVSLGTGKDPSTVEMTEAVISWGDLQWSQDIFPIMLNGTAKFNTMLIEKFFPFPAEVYRVDTALHSFKNRIDDISPGNIKRLNRDGAIMVKHNQNQLDQLVEKLLRP